MNTKSLNVGITNVSKLEGDKVIRNNNSDAIWINRNAEAEVFNLTGFNKPVVISNDQNRLITKYIKNYEFDVREIFPLVIKEMKKMHQGKIDFIFDPFKLIEQNEGIVEYDINRISSLKQVWASRKKVLCHNDLHSGNFIYDGKEVVLLDFEYAGMNDYLFDLASFITENNIQELASNVLNEYDGNTNNIDLLMEYMYLNDVLWSIWGIKSGNKKIVMDKIQRL